jgi:glyoxylase-like metal-dependent hydrolase (beta-lactamase superfamily II)
MTHICVTCGTQFPPAARPLEHCPICEDERQYIGPNGQQWTTLEKLQQTHRNTFHQEGEGVWGIETVPKFGIGQRALLVRAGNKNILWDCISLIDADTIALVEALGGISTIAISHPHYYGSMIDWSRAFGDVPIYLHEDDRKWVQRPDADVVTFWRGETLLIEGGFTLIRVGGHFDGFQVLHSAHAENGQGSLFSGDLPQVCPDKHYVSFMYSYPNYIPLDAASVLRVVAALDPFPFEKLYGAWKDFVVEPDAKQAVKRSAARYLEAIGESPEDRGRGTATGAKKS